MAPKPPDNLLTIGHLAERTGVAPATLRSWESRYSFPRPIRLPGGHRRYVESDVSAVLEVLRHRDSGLALDAAVRRATTFSLGSRSVYAELRRRHPELAPQLLSKTTVLAISRAIEDECCARAEQPLLFGAFQREAFLVQSYSRWVELARTARGAIVFADGDRPRPHGPTGRGTPIEVSLPHDAPLKREWVVICDAPDLPACMAAVERPGQAQAPDSRRRFETVWTVDPQAVRHASRVAAALADDYRPGWRTPELVEAGDELAGIEPQAASADLRRATDLLNRMVGYLEAAH